MKQIIPFKKDITFKTKVEEITSISLDHDLKLKGEDLITGSFFIKGKFKMTKASQLEEDFNYKIPCDIAISASYDTFDATIDIDDFYYELKDDSTLVVNIALEIDNLHEKEKEEEKEVKEEKEERINPINIIKETKQTIFEDKEDTYSTYYVYLVKEEDTIEKIIEKYKVTKEDLLKYNDLKDLKEGLKLIIPDVKHE